MNTPLEVWRNQTRYKSLDSHPGIYVSAQGEIISYRRVGPSPKGGIMHREPVSLSCSKDKDGYLFITRPKRFLHEIVLSLWSGKRPEGMQARHLSGNKLDNSISNLRWGTPAENGLDKREHGKSKGRGNHRAKMSEPEVIEIRQARHHMTLSAVCALYPMYSKFAVWAATSGYTWTHLPNAFAGKRKCSKNGWRSGVSLK